MLKSGRDRWSWNITPALMYPPYVRNNKPHSFFAPKKKSTHSQASRRQMLRNRWSMAYKAWLHSTLIPRSMCSFFNRGCSWKVGIDYKLMEAISIDRNVRTSAIDIIDRSLKWIDRDRSFQDRLILAIDRDYYKERSFGSLRSIAKLKNALVV